MDYLRAHNIIRNEIKIKLVIVDNEFFVKVSDLNSS